MQNKTTRNTIQLDDDITLGMALAGGLEAKRLVDDPRFMQKPNWPGELAARVYQEMKAEQECKKP